MDLLNVNVKSASNASKPSLISSLWSLQVQLQNDPDNDPSIGFPTKSLSQQSLPDLQKGACASSYNDQPIKMSRSLTDLGHQPTVAEVRMSEPVKAPDDGTSDDGRYWVPLSRQQRNQNICQWLHGTHICCDGTQDDQRLDAGPSSATSLTVSFAPDTTRSEDVVMSDCRQG